MKSWVIALKEVPGSLKLGEVAVAAGREHGWDIERFDAFLGLAGRQWLDRHGYSPQRPDAPHYDAHFYIDRSPCKDGQPKPSIMTPGMMGSIASHIALWERCVALDQPIAILEHDAEPVAPPPTVNFNDCLVLGPSLELMENHGTFVEPIDMAGSAVQPLHFLFRAKPAQRSLPLAACYALTPTGAAKLLADARQWGYAPIDTQVRHPVVDLQVLVPHVCTFQKGYIYNPSLTDSRSEDVLGGDEKAWSRRKLSRQFSRRFKKVRDALRGLLGSA